jgi:outer membrane protein OmpA-like peptidoglycan-associated protein
MINDRIVRSLPPLFLGAALAACATTPQENAALERVRADLEALQSDPQLSHRAPIALNEAEAAVNAAENADNENFDHALFIAEQRVAIAEAQAKQRYYVEQREQLSSERERIRLDARTREAELARQEAEEARREARQLAMETAAQREEAARMQREIEELNARPTERGLVLTLSDVLFEVDDDTLKPGAHADLDKLVEFLERYAERDVRIEGHTDATGEESYNLDLSRRRAEAVREYLVAQGIDRQRIVTVGRGENVPVATNQTVAGRQLNRRVEIVIENPSVARR